VTRPFSGVTRAHSETDKLFSMLDGAALSERPIPECNRIAFYVGHLEEFDWNLLRKSLRISSFNPEFDQLFAFGIDPVDGNPSTDRAHDCPSVLETDDYRIENGRSLKTCLSQFRGGRPLSSARPRI
jgi:iron(II)-dependent oxidoreductase